MRDTGTERLDRLRTLKGPEGCLRGIGDVVWACFNKEHTAEGRGPDQGKHGFRGMQQPDQWRARLVAWDDIVRNIAARNASAFSERAADSDRRSAPETNMRRLKNRSFAFALTLPKQWVGRIGGQESKPLRILGLNTPINQVRKLSDDPIYKAPETWNFITINGRSGMTFKLNVNILIQSEVLPHSGLRTD